jgi:hypothetical protein
VANELIHLLQFPNWAAEFFLLGVLLFAGHWRKLPALTLYVACFAGVDALLRPLVQEAFGFSSSAYFYVYWISDVGLTLSTFLLVCLFFRQAFAKESKHWPAVRTGLIATFVLTGLVCYLSIESHYAHLYINFGFVMKFSQDLYFACLILITALFVLLQASEGAGDQLHLLVSGLGIQYAGPAAAMALDCVASGRANGVMKLAIEFCNLAMFLTWLYAVTRAAERAPAKNAPEVTRIPVLTPVPVAVRAMR